MRNALGNRRHTIQQQIQFAIILISIVSMIVLGVTVFAVTANQVEKNYQEDFSYNLQTSDNILKLQMDNVIAHMRNLLLKDLYLNALSDAPKDEGRYFTTAKTRTLENAVSEITLQMNTVQEVLSVSLDGKLYVHSKKADVSQYLPLYKAYGDEMVKEQEWAKQAVAADGKELIWGQNVLTGKEDTLSVVKYLKRPQTNEGVGFLIVNVSKNIFRQAFDNRGNYNTNCFMVIDKNARDQLIYFGGDPAFQDSMYQMFLAGNTRKTPYVFSSRESFANGWVLVSGILSEELSQQKWNLGILILALILALVAVGVFVAYRISQRIYQPLGKLEMTIQQVEEGNRNITEEFDNSEVGLLGQKFKEMVNHNLVLRERLLYAKIKQREQELHLLQEQINPHFLYNALDALYCMAIVHEEDDIAKMVAALSDNFRLSLNKGSNLIQVKDELEHIRAYVTIQNMRYKDRFHLEIDVEEGLLEKRILKLLLIPFVENAVYHGLETKIGEGTIRITGKIEGKKMVFCVTDDGVGVEDMSRLEKGYGINNVKERIELYYKEGSQVDITSTPGQGTFVKITLMDKEMGMLAEDEEISSH